jgi:hypothetical protein
MSEQSAQDRSDDKNELERYEIYREFYQYLVQTKKEEEHRLSDIILTLSTGVLAGFCSLIFVQSGEFKNPSDKSLVYIGVTFLVISVSASLIERWCSFKAYEKALKELKLETLFQNDNSKSVAATYIPWLYGTAMFTFAVGTFVLGLTLLAGRI